MGIKGETWPDEREVGKASKYGQKPEETMSMRMGNEICHESRQAHCSLWKFFHCLLQFGVWSRNWSAEFRGNPLTLFGISYTSLGTKLSMRCQVQRQTKKFHFCYTAFENSLSQLGCRVTAMALLWPPTRTKGFQVRTLLKRGWL